MKKNLKIAAAFLAALVMTAGVASCGSDSNDSNTSNTGGGGTTTAEQTEFLKNAENVYTNDVVIATYRGLADACEQLQADVEAINSDATVNTACAQWKKARKYWEFSEAFLYGAASGYGIDPHIDTWPFDETAFNNHLANYDPTNEASQANMENIVATGENLTGFHALEYLIFRDGTPRAFSAISSKELAYAKLVAADLYLSAVRLEAAWAGLENVSHERQQLLEDAEKEPDANFGEYMIEAGNAGSIYKTRLAAAIQIIDGCKDIADEVAKSKIGKPYNGEDIHYIESPNAYNSIIDFYDNIMSCKHALYGTMSSIDSDFDTALTTPAQYSVMAYAEKYCPDQAADVKAKLTAALEAISKMKSPFVLYYTDTTAKTAIDAISAFDQSMTDLEEAMLK